MSFSSQLLSFLGVASLYIGFTFVWAWYKGRQEAEAGGGVVDYGGES